MKEAYIKGSDRVCAVIGDPIEHTLSPLIHNELIKKMQQGAIYVPFCVKKESLEAAIKGAHALGIKGMNVTMPHKQELFKYVVAVDEEAQKINAINTLVEVEGGYKGYNTDAKGLRMSLEEQQVVWNGKNVAIIGSGGAAYAAYVAVAKEAASIHIFNRTLEKAEALKNYMAEFYETPTFVYEMASKANRPIEVVIQTTGVGMGSLKDQMPACSLNVLENAEVAVDLIYNPAETLFLKLAKEKGCKCINGFGMLFYQAVIAFELMHQVKCDTSQILQLKKQLQSV